MKAGRSCLLNIELIDKPGQLQLVSTIVSKYGGNIISIHHERANEGDISGCFLRTMIETRNFEQIENIKRSLNEAGFKIMP